VKPFLTIYIVPLRLGVSAVWCFIACTEGTEMEVLKAHKEVFNIGKISQVHSGAW